MTIDQIKELALHSVRGTAPADFSVDSVNAALRDALRELGGSINKFNKNRYDIYEIFLTVADEIIPQRVIDTLQAFCEIKTVRQNEKAIFRTHVGKERARKFITRVALSGVYEHFRLDVDNFEVPTTAVGGGATIDFERWLDGAEDLNELMDVLLNGMTDAIFGEVQRALHAAMTAANRPAANLVIANTFNPAKMVALGGVVRSYGSQAMIFAPPEFIGAMGPDAIAPVGANYQGVYHPQDIDAIHNTGYINLFRGMPVIEIPQSYTDRSNTTTWIDPQVAYVLPLGNEKVVKLVLEGNTQIDDFKNRDRSREVDVYRKVGVGIVSNHNWGIYQNTGIPQTYNP